MYCIYIYYIRIYIYYYPYAGKCCFSVIFVYLFTSKKISKK